MDVIGRPMSVVYRVLYEQTVTNIRNERDWTALTRGDGKNMRHLKMRSEGPNYAGGGVWVMSYTFEMMLMKIKVREEFIMDEQGKIKELTRIRM